ncbi:PadR family transcriptional regulator [Rouxiella badensis]|nr:PadR family transcriptional regulator [Rouxiella badensis]
MRKTSAIHAPNKKMPERRGKTFKNEELLLLILYFVRLNTTHGYEIIKSIAHYSMGAYSPSPGVIYPNLTLLEELGYAVAQAVDGSKKSTQSPAAVSTILSSINRQWSMHWKDLKHWNYRNIL